jgi:hypothetical protein
MAMTAAMTAAAMSAVAGLDFLFFSAMAVTFIAGAGVGAGNVKRSGEGGRADRNKMLLHCSGS